MKPNLLSFLLLVGPFLMNGQIESNTSRNFSWTDEERQPRELPAGLGTKFFGAPTTDQIFIDFVGSGDIQQSLSNGTDVNANTGIGIIFERSTNKLKSDTSTSLEPNKNILQSIEIEAVFNIASTADTIVALVDAETGNISNRRNFGNYLLNPISAKQSVYVNSNVFFGYPDNKFGRYFAKVISGINFRVIASNNTWQYEDVAKELGVIAFRTGVFHEFLPDNFRLDEKMQRVKYSLFLGANYSYRGIFGDITAAENDAFREGLLGTTKSSFSAFEVNFGFRLSNLRVEFQMPMFKSKNNIPGFTDTQFMFSLKFVGGFGLKLNTSQE